MDHLTIMDEGMENCEIVLNEEDMELLEEMINLGMLQNEEDRVFWRTEVITRGTHEGGPHQTDDMDVDNEEEESDEEDWKLQCEIVLKEDDMEEIEKRLREGLSEEKICVHLEEDIEEIEKGPKLGISGGGVPVEIQEEDNSFFVFSQQPGCRDIPKPISSLLEIPAVLYRVYDNYSVSQYNAFGFTAGKSLQPTTTAEFRDMIKYHIDWCNWKIRTPFISMTSSIKEVQRHVGIRRRTNRSNIKIAIIDTRVLLHDCKAQIWEMHNAMQFCSVGPPRQYPLRSFDYEYICALEVPATAIITCCNPSDILAVSPKHLVYFMF